MTGPSTLIEPHAAAIVATLAQALHASNSHAKLRAARLLLSQGWGPPGRDPQAEAIPYGGLRPDQLERAIELLRTHLPLDLNEPNRAATPCPARQGEDIGAERATTPCPAAEPPTPATMPGTHPSINPMSRERSPSPLAAPPGTNSPRGDADPMSRALLLARNSADDPFRRPLPQPPDMEPPRPFHHEGYYRHRRWR